MSSEKRFEDTDFLADDTEGHPLALPYFKLHRDVLEKFIEHDLSAIEQRIYLYLCHNCLIHQGRTFKLDIEQIAAYVKRGVRTVYYSLEALVDADLITFRQHGNIVLNMPYIVKAQVEAKTTAVSATTKERESKLEGHINKSIADVEQTLRRTLTMRERENLTRIMTTRLLTEQD